MAPTWGSGFKAAGEGLKKVGQKVASYRIPRTQLLDKGDDKKPPTTVKAAEKPAAKPPAGKPAPASRRAYEDPGPSGGSTKKKGTSAKKSAPAKASSDDSAAKNGAKAQSVLDAAKSRGGVDQESTKGYSERSGKIDEKERSGFKGGAYKPRTRSRLRRAVGGAGKVARALVGKRTAKSYTQKKY
jgi:hypothetical protein